jgi:hypothetical protein
MIEARRNTEAAVNACIVLCRDIRNAARFEKGDKLIAPNIEEKVPKAPTLFGLYRVRNDGFEAVFLYLIITNGF